MNSPTTTFLLLQQAKAGENLALSHAFDRTRRRLAIVVASKLAPAHRSFAGIDDIVQETCLRAFQDIHSFTYQSPGSFMRWLSTIAEHVIIDHFRHANRARRAAPPAARRLPLLLPLRRRLHLGRPHRSRCLPRTLCPVAQGGRPLDPRPVGIPLPHQRRHLLHARSPL